mmetsp:Transcript_1970/g.3733  ORF Transcript_1970/g.3733 Transcript_1970/m.3733 type:complete len:525 (+) Transcript_1970:420-1994(+)
MSYAKTMSFLPLPPMSPSDDEAKKSSVPVRDKVAIRVSQIAQSSGTSNNISPVPTHKNMKTMYGQLLTPAPGRLTPTGQGRIKAPPVCLEPSLKRVATSIDEFNTAGGCFSLKEADCCAEKALMMDGKVSDNVMEEMPLNIEMCDAGFSWKSHVESASAVTSEVKAFVSSNSTIVSTSSASSCGRSAMGNEIAVVASVTVKKDPPLEVVRTNLAFTSEDENTRATSAPQQPCDVSDAKVTATVTAKSLQPAIAPERVSSSTSLSTTFTDNLVKDNSSRQGRSLQRWLIHSPTDELVRQVAGTIPITRDGRIILISASKKAEWILPKGGWDADETKEECAARETYEEGGLLGRLGGCLEPIDYETAKAKKRRLSKLGNGVVGVGDGKEQGNGKSNASGKLKRSKREDEGLLPPLPKRVKADKPMASISTGSELTSSSIKKAESSESTCRTPAPTAPSDPKKYSYVRLSLFPLYVSSVKSDWPEKGRIRKLVDIDEAIKIMDAENRIYFKRGLEMVKEQGLHLLKP